MGIKSQAFSVFEFEKAYLCCIKIDNFLINHTFLIKKLLCFSFKWYIIIMFESHFCFIKSNIIWIMSSYWGGKKMKKVISVILIVVALFSCLALSGCGGDDDCFACGGSGYYQKKDCPFC